MDPFIVVRGVLLLLLRLETACDLVFIQVVPEKRSSPNRGIKSRILSAIFDNIFYGFRPLVCNILRITDPKVERF